MNNQKQLMTTIHVFSSLFFKPIIHIKGLLYNSLTDITSSDNVYKIYTTKYIFYIPKSLLPINLISRMIKNNHNDVNPAFFKYLHEMLKINKKYDKFDNSYLISYANKTEKETYDVNIDTDTKYLNKTKALFKFDEYEANVPVYMEQSFIDIFELNELLENLTHNNKYEEFTNEYVTFVMKFSFSDNMKKTVSVTNITLHKDKHRIHRIKEQIFNMMNLLCFKHECQFQYQ